ncbi:hypothetical protein J6590_032685 [Homalodisca vitripennis]|nr:hypothetical protein J6590_032685 [Homalodisca vitripennis]
MSLDERERITLLMMVGWGNNRRSHEEACHLFNDYFHERQPISRTTALVEVRSEAKPRGYGVMSAAEAGQCGLTVQYNIHDYNIQQLVCESGLAFAGADSDFKTHLIEF